jgi:carbonic anhydrase
MPHRLFSLLETNRRWSERRRSDDPGFFERLSRQQAPEYLWIGCSDSRVPANEIVAMDPGELFVHRNVANVVVHSDLNCLSVMQFAVDVLKVKHIIVCGHYGCGGVAAAYRGARLGLIDNWLRHVQDVREKHAERLRAAPDERAALDMMCELNVIEQVIHVCETTVVGDAWDRGQPLTVHGWIYGLQDGLLRQLGMCVRDPGELAGAVQGALASLDPA